VLCRLLWLIALVNEVSDRLGRMMRDLRISVTDRCNFRCRYCMPAEVFGAGYSFLPREEILSFGEIERLARVFVGMGVQKLRLTGGEPLLRRDLEVLVQNLAGIEGVKDLAMTTNGVLLKKKSEVLKESGLDRVTVSLDALDDGVFGEMNGVGAKVEKVVEGVDAALAAGLGVKVNSVIKKGVNDNEVVPLVDFAMDRGISVRFIEYMDTGNANRWKLDEVFGSEELLDSIRVKYDLVRVEGKLGETAVRYGVNGVEGFEVGVISSVTKPFCRDCNRARLSADGKIFTCLFASEGGDVKSVLRDGASDDELVEWMSGVWREREDRYSELRAGLDGEVVKAEMSYLGG